MKTPLLTLGLLAVLLISGCAANQHWDNNSWLASAAIATVVSGVVSSVVSLLVKDKEYKNDYYKKVIDKRIRAIEALENYAILFNTNRKKTKNNIEIRYHNIFLNENHQEALKNGIENIASSGLWLSDNTIKCIKKLTHEAEITRVECRQKGTTEIIEIAGNHFSKIESARIELEHSLRVDMASLHNVKAFFKAKAIDVEKYFATTSDKMSRSSV